MKTALVNLTKESVTSHVKLVKRILREFRGLRKLYSEIAIIFGNTDDVKNGRFRKAVIDYLGDEEIIFLGKPIFSVSSVSKPPRACLEINTSEYRMFENWKRELAIRHECCHLLHPEEAPETYIELKEGFSEDYLKNFARYRREYCALLCVIKRYPEEWLRSPVGFSEKTESPADFYAKKKNEDEENARYWSTANIVHLLSLLYLYEHIPKKLKSKLGNRRKIAEKFLGEFFIQVQKDTPTCLPRPETWLTQQDFLSGEAYFNRIRDILASVKPRPTARFSHVAIGGQDSWRSESMKRIRAAKKEDVATIMRFNLPFLLLRLPDGSYEMKKDGHIYEFSITRIRRSPETAKDLTGWTPHGNIDIVSDRFGRFSYSRVRIQIPYRIDEVRWDYFCPNCKFETEESATKCPVCETKLRPEKSRRPPLRRVKKKAIELMNKFLDAYRFFFKDYYIEHIRYDDIVSYEIEYVMDGTKASWVESFDVSSGSVAEAGTLIAEPEEIICFQDVLSTLDKRMVLRDYYLTSAENRIATEEYHLAILESVIALEITLSDFIMRQSEKLGVPKKEATDLVRILGVYGNLRAILRLLTKDEEQASDATYRACERSIQKRNKIAHKGETAASYNEAKKGVWNIERMIHYVEELGM